MHDRIAYQGITFDDILLEPGYSEYLPREVDVRTQLTAQIGLNLPILSSPILRRARVTIAARQSICRYTNSRAADRLRWSAHTTRLRIGLIRIIRGARRCNAGSVISCAL